MSLSHPGEGWGLTRVALPNLAAISKAHCYGALNSAFMGIHRSALFSREILAGHSTEQPLNRVEIELRTKLPEGTIDGRLG